MIPDIYRWGTLEWSYYFICIFRAWRRSNSTDAWWLKFSLSRLIDTHRGFGDRIVAHMDIWNIWTLVVPWPLKLISYDPWWWLTFYNIFFHFLIFPGVLSTLVPVSVLPWVSMDFFLLFVSIPLFLLLKYWWGFVSLMISASPQNFLFALSQVHHHLFLLLFMKNWKWVWVRARTIISLGGPQMIAYMLQWSFRANL